MSFSNQNPKVTNAIPIGLIDTGAAPEYRGLFRNIAGFQDISITGELTGKSCHDKATHGSHSAALLCRPWPTDTPEIPPLPQVPVQLYVCAAITRKNVVANILTALEWMLDQPIQVLVMPLGIKETSPIFQPYLQRIKDKGILVIVAVGNDGSGSSRSPGNYNNVLSVGACDWAGNVPSFSSSAQHPRLKLQCIKPDLLAPGVDIPFSKHGKTIKESGTSMACALAGRYAAWLWYQYPERTAEEIKQALIQSSHPLAEGSQHRCANGYIDIEAAKAWLSNLSKWQTTATANIDIVPASYIEPKLQELVPKKGKSERLLLMLRDDDTLENLAIDSVIVLRQFKGVSVCLIELLQEDIPLLVKAPIVKVVQYPSAKLINL